MSGGGAFVRLNLGPRFSGAGGFTPLNLGVDWDENPVEPVVRGLSLAVSIAWREAGQASCSTRVGWGTSRSLRCSRLVPWEGASRVDGSTSVAWGVAPHIVGQAGFRWRNAALVGESVGLPWGGLPQASRFLLAGWRGRLDVTRITARIAWMRGLPVHAKRALPWQGAPSRASDSWSDSWNHLGATRRHGRLPWGSARPLPWVIRPPVKPDPDPDPEPGVPPGYSVSLNLGCSVVGIPGLAPLNLGTTACYVVRPQRRTYVVINEVSFVRLPDRTPIEVSRISLSASRSAWGWTFDVELADPTQLSLLKPTAGGPRQFEVSLNGHVWTGIIESFQKQREFADGGVRLSGRSRTALLAAPYAPARVKVANEDRSIAQLVAEELADTGFTSQYETVDWTVPAGAWFYDASTPLDAISALAEASGAVVQSHPQDLSLHVRASYPVSPWLWRDTQPAHVVQEDIVLTESLQMRSAPLYDAVVVTGEIPGKGVTCKVRKAGEAGQLYAQQVSSPLISVAAAGAERGRNVLSDRGEQAAVDLTVPLFPKPLKAGEVGAIMPLDLVEVVAAEGTWHGQCESLRIEVVIDQQAVVIEQTATLERHYTDAD
ncbi:hypothetical protein CEE61_08180 [Stenotrophomonas maltophilia]|nr:hypothetical protein CEE61_08180 [Stenotrophomonas maltophilia]